MKPTITTWTSIVTAVVLLLSACKPIAPSPASTIGYARNLAQDIHAIAADTSRCDSISLALIALAAEEIDQVLRLVEVTP